MYDREELDRIERMVVRDQGWTSTQLEDIRGVFGMARQMLRIVELAPAPGDLVMLVQGADDRAPQVILQGDVRGPMAALAVRLADLERQINETNTCWHCQCSLLPDEGRRHCLDCPSECDGCPRCAPQHSTEQRSLDEHGAPRAHYSASSHSMTRCQSNDDGDCDWPGCPQLRDGEPKRSGRHCPLDTGDEE